MRSFMISADNAHSVHPNHPEYADPVNRPVINGGIVIKYSAAPLNLWALMDSISTPNSFTSTGMAPTACTASVCTIVRIPA